MGAILKKSKGPRAPARQDRFAPAGEPMGYPNGMDAYEFVEDNPITLIDPSGMDAMDLSAMDGPQLVAYINDLEARKNYDYSQPHWMVEGEGPWVLSYDPHMEGEVYQAPGQPGPNSAWLWSQIQAAEAALSVFTSDAEALKRWLANNKDAKLGPPGEQSVQSADYEPPGLQVEVSGRLSRPWSSLGFDILNKVINGKSNRQEEGEAPDVDSGFEPISTNQGYTPGEYAEKQQDNQDSAAVAQANAEGDVISAVVSNIMWATFKAGIDHGRGCKRLEMWDQNGKELTGEEISQTALAQWLGYSAGSK